MERQWEDPASFTYLIKHVSQRREYAVMRHVIGCRHINMTIKLEGEYNSAVTTGGPGGPGPPKIWALKIFSSKIFAVLFHRFNTTTFCKKDVKEAYLSHSRGWKIENFPQPWWSLLSYYTILKSGPPNIKSVVTALYNMTL